MAADNKKKRAHLPCVCVPPSREKYCSQFCEDAGDEEAEIAWPAASPPVLVRETKVILNRTSATQEFAV